MIDLEAAILLEALAGRIARIKPMTNRDPYAFYEERSDVAHEIRELAVRFRGGPAKATPGADVPPAAPRPARHSHTLQLEGRTVQVLTRASVR